MRSKVDIVSKRVLSVCYPWVTLPGQAKCRKALIAVMGSWMTTGDGAGGYDFSGYAISTLLYTALPEKVFQRKVSKTATLSRFAINTRCALLKFPFTP
jgi:hypothetical protein